MHYRGIFFTDRQQSDAYSIKTGLQLQSLNAGTSLTLKIATANTGASTLAVDDIGAIAIKVYDPDGARDTATGEIKAGMSAQLIYDGTYWVLTNPVQKKERVLLFACGRATISQSNTFYETFGYCTAWGVTSVGSDNVRMPLPAGTLKNMRLRFAGNTVDGGATVTVFKNGVATSLAVTCAFNVTTGSDTTNEVTFADGDLVSLRLAAVAGGSGSATNYAVTAEFYPD